MQKINLIPQSVLESSHCEKVHNDDNNANDDYRKYSVADKNDRHRPDETEKTSIQGWAIH